MKAYAHKILAQLKAEYPLPAHVQLSIRCYDKPTLKATGIVQTNCEAFGYVRRWDSRADIHVALKQTVTKVINTIAHEYYHCMQKYLLGKPDVYPELEPEAEIFAREFTFKHLQRINAERKTDRLTKSSTSASSKRQSQGAPISLSGHSWNQTCD